ncbi:hypothetical protein pb186bvf_018952 [Paramecium bursaria]
MILCQVNYNQRAKLSAACLCQSKPYIMLFLFALINFEWLYIFYLNSQMYNSQNFSYYYSIKQIQNILLGKIIKEIRKTQQFQSNQNSSNYITGVFDEKRQKMTGNFDKQF